MVFKVGDSAEGMVPESPRLVFGSKQASLGIESILRSQNVRRPSNSVSTDIPQWQSKRPLEKETPSDGRDPRCLTG